MAIVVAFANHKGGVGKTASVAALGTAFANAGYRVLMVDLDTQANLTYQFIGVDEEKECIFFQYLCTQLKELVDVVFHLPDFTLRATSIGWRVHDDGIVLVATADFSFHEFRFRLKTAHTPVLLLKLDQIT